MKLNIRVLIASVIIPLFIISCNNIDEKGLMVKKEINSNWFFKQDSSDKWMPAKVPGTVHTDLLDNGIIDDPFYRLNEHEVQWVDKEGWEYKTQFNIDKELLQYHRVALDFKGLDTYADVYLNGIKLLSSDNMFREWDVDIREAIKEGQNELHIVFKSPIAEGIKKYDAQGYVIPASDNDLAKIGKVEGNKKVSIYTRKAGYHFGWDWGPRLVSSGIWRPVYLKAWNEARITSLQIIQGNLNESKANLTAVFEIEAENDKKATISVKNNNEQLATLDVEIKKGTGAYKLEFAIDNPKLWWTNGLGEQHLYNLVGELETNGIKASKETRIGLRTLELVREKDKRGTSFYFKLNGHPVFMKGANYIPNDVFLPRVSDEDYKTVIETAKNSNFNMLRIWGGGIYENDIFYDLCDEAGILVWQDFMFACAMFPGDEAFLENVKQEAADNVKRLRNHPSIALWCGNNEILAAWYGWGWKRAAENESKENADKIWEAYTNIFHKVLPDVVAKHDPQRSYWGSSPSSGIGIPADLVNGDEHYWGVWWGKQPFQTYATHIARFMSEYGFQSFPEIATVKKYALPKDYHILSDVMKSHQRSSIGNETIEYYMLKEYEQPKDFESFLYVNHVLQAEGIKFALEGHRRAMPYCMGSLYWQINDCWPVASWSSTDYYQRWKALQYYAKKGFEQVLVSPYLKADSIKINIINDNLESISGELKVQITDFDGKVLYEKTQGVDAPANSNATYFKSAKDKLLAGMDTQDIVMAVELIQKGNIIAGNVLYFRPFKELNIPAPLVTYTLTKTENGYSMVLSSDKLAKNVLIETGDETVVFSDNYFDLLPGKEKKVELKTTINEEKLEKIMSIRTLDSAF